MPPPHRKTPAKRIKRHRQRDKARVDPVRLGRLLKQRKSAGLVLALVLILVIALIDRGAGLLPVDDDWHRYHGQSFEVLRVIDGDTLEMSVPDGDRATTRVRLWGVDTPEMGRPDEGRPPEPFAIEATEFSRDAVEGQRVTVHLQDHRLRGRHGRLLAYIELQDGRILNAILIENGLSEHDSRWGHDQAEQYDRLEQQARQGRKGMWAQ